MGIRLELDAYYGGGQRVWPPRYLTCTDAKIASPHLIAPVIAASRMATLDHEAVSAVLGRSSMVTLARALARNRHCRHSRVQVRSC